MCNLRVRAWCAHARLCVRTLAQPVATCLVLTVLTREALTGDPQESAAEASARELELKKSLEALRANAAQELHDAKSYLQAQLAAAHESLNAAEAGKMS